MPTKETKIKLKPMTRAATFSPSTLDAESRTVEVIWSTGASVLRSGWDGNYYEKLSLDPAQCNLGRLNSGAPLLAIHDGYDMGAVLGVVEKAWLGDGEARATVRFSKRSDVEPIFQDIRDGILRNISVGYTVNKFVQVAGGEGTVPTFLAVDWEPFEISLVPVGADDGAKVRTACQSEVECLVQMEDITMPEPIVSAAPETGVEMKKERARALAISKMVRVAKLEDTIAESMIGEGVSIEDASTRVFAELEKRQVVVQTAPPTVEITRDEVEAKREGMVDAIMLRAHPNQVKPTEKGRRFSGMSIVEASRSFLGEKAQDMSRQSVFRAMISSSDFAWIVANIANKSMAQGYALQPQTFKPIVQYGTLKDYKEATRIKFGEISDLSQVDEGAEYTFAQLSDSAEKIKLGKYGKKVALTEEVFLNDDLHVLAGRVTTLFGNAAARLESKMFYDIVQTNAALADGVALFHATHSNLGSAAVIAETGISAMRVAIRTQMDPNAKDYLNLEPKFLVVGPAKETEAKKYLTTSIWPNQASQVNPYAGTMSLIVESRITGNKWFSMVSPDQIDMIEMAYLEGAAGPQVDTFADRENDRVIIKCKHVVGVKALDHRGMFYNPGA